MNTRHKLNTIGGHVTEIEDIMQCYETIFKTRKGSVVCNPNLGWNVIEYLGKPVNQVAGKMKTELMSELNKQEPRGVVTDAKFSYGSADDFANGRLSVEVYFVQKTTNKAYTGAMTL